ncbi:hypothetical protein DV736_g4299, partial [Chaetothyriales sp. CBS 134916]
MMDVLRRKSVEDPEMPSNFPALRLSLAYLLHDPTSLLPHQTVSTFLALPIPVTPGLPALPSTLPKTTIRALVLDKDNTLCPPETTKLHPDYLAKIEKLKASTEFSSNRHSILIVSNTAGSTSSPAHEEEAVLLEKQLGLDVLRQHPQRRKPFCGPDVLAYFKKHDVTDNPAEIAVVGDRLATDVLLARDMGSWSIWCQDGWRDPKVPTQDYRGFLSRLESRFESIMRTRVGRMAPFPRSGPP